MIAALRRLVNLGVGDQTASEIRRIQTINLTTLFGIFFNVSYNVWLALIDIGELWPVMITNSFFVVAGIAALLMNHRSHIDAATWLLGVAVWVNLTFAPLLVGPPVLFFVLVLPITGVLITREGDLRTPALFLGVSLAILLTIVLVDPDTSPAIANTWVETAMTIVSALGTALFIGVVGLYFKRVSDAAEAEMRAARQRSEDLLLNILPAPIADRLTAGEHVIADRYDWVSVLFADVVDFTPMSATMSPEDLVLLLDDIFKKMDDMVESLGLEKVKTVGDAYMVAAGVPEPRNDHAHAVAQLALHIRDEFSTPARDGRQIRFRIGVHSGPVVAGVIGHKKFSYDLWGDTVNTASRLESQGVPGEIQISTATRNLISDSYRCERRGLVEVKGKGQMETWVLKEPQLDPR